MTVIYDPMSTEVTIYLHLFVSILESDSINFDFVLYSYSTSLIDLNPQFIIGECNCQFYILLFYL